MEPKDWITVGISTLALFVALGSAVFSYRQYSLNQQRDAREQARDSADRTPIVTATVSRPEQQRRFKIDFEITNRPFSEARLDFAELEGAGTTTNLGILTQPTDRLRGITIPPRVGRVVFDPNRFAVGEKLTWPVNVDISDEAPLPAGATVTFNFEFTLLDNEERHVVVNRVVRLR